MPVDPTPLRNTVPAGSTPLTAGRMHRALLRGCVERWAADTLRTDTARAPHATELRYVHGWAAGAGPREVDTEAPVEVLHVLDRIGADWARSHRALRLSAVLLEEDPVLADRLEEALVRAGFGARLHRGADAASLPPGGIALCTTISETAIAELGEADPAPHTFLSLGPPRPEHLPFPLLRSLLARPRTEILLRVPSGALGGQTPAAVPLADLSPYARRIAEGYAAMLGTTPAEWLAQWRGAPPGEADEVLVSRYRVQIRATTAEHVVKRISLTPPLTGAAAGHWFLVSPDPVRVLAANRLPETAAWEGVSSWAAQRFLHPPGPARSEPIEMFGSMAAEPRGRAERKVDAGAVAAFLGGDDQSDRAAFTKLAESDLFPEELRRVLRALRLGRRQASRPGETLPLFPPAD